MPWTTPLTAVANVALTAAQWNASVRDNLLETAPAKATTVGRIFVTSGTNAIAERSVKSDFTGTSETTTSTSYANLATLGPQIGSVTGTGALTMHSALTSNNTAGSRTFTSIDVSGATTLAASDTRAFAATSSAANESYQASHVFLWEGVLTGGTNTFTMKYRVTANTGAWSQRGMQVIAM